MLKKSASGVLAVLRGSTYRSVRLASSLAAALLDDLFEHPVVDRVSLLSAIFQRQLMYKPSFSADC
jgi:adenosylmethionine-8-amino-7-oxononanoate aminotransferase